MLERVQLGALYLLVLVAAAMTVALLRELLPLLVFGRTPAVGTALGIHRPHVMDIAAAVALIAVAVVPLLAFVVNEYALTPSASDPHAVEGHYVMMAALAVAPLAYGLSAALGFGGWRVAAWIAALGPFYHGLMSIALPCRPVWPGRRGGWPPSSGRSRSSWSRRTRARRP